MLKIDIPDAVDRNKESTLLFRAITYPHHICEMRFANEKQTIHNRRKTPPFIWKNFVVMIPPGKQKFIEIEISSHGDTALLAVQDVLFYQ